VETYGQADGRTRPIALLRPPTPATCRPIQRWAVYIELTLVHRIQPELPVFDLQHSVWCCFSLRLSPHASPCGGVVRVRTVNKVKLAHTRLPSVGFRSWSRFLAVSLQLTWVINPAVGCHYFPPGLQLPSQPLRGLLSVLLLGEQRHNGCEQFA